MLKTERAHKPTGSWAHLHCFGAAPRIVMIDKRVLNHQLQDTGSAGPLARWCHGCQPHACTSLWGAGVVCDAHCRLLSRHAEPKQPQMVVRYYELQHGREALATHRAIIQQDHGRPEEAAIVLQLHHLQCCIKFKLKPSASCSWSQPRWTHGTQLPPGGGRCMHASASRWPCTHAPPLRQ